MGGYTAVIGRDKDGSYLGEIVELLGCFTQARSIEGFLKRIREAIELHLQEIEIKK